MHGHSIHIARPSDRMVLETFERIAKQHEDLQPKLAFSLLGGFSESYSPSTDSRPEEFEFLTHESSMIAQATMQFDKFYISLHRGGRQERKNQFTDEIYVPDSRDSPLSYHQELKIVSSIFSEFRQNTHGDADPIFSQETAERAAIHESVLARLEALNFSLIEKNHQQIQKLSEDHQSWLTEQDLRLQEQRAQLDQEYQARLDGLARQETELQERIAALDDKSNTHARRQLRKDIIDEIKRRQTEFRLTTGTNRLRLPVAIAMIGMIGFFAAMTAVTAVDFHAAITTAETQLMTLTGIKQLLYSFGTIGSALFYIRWQNRWFEQHSMAEFHLKQLELDMERASWIVETSLEWNDAKGNTIPPELLASLSKNLFTEQKDKPDALIHPADQLASAILGSASMVRLQAGDTEIQLDPRKLKKVKPTEVPATK